MENKAYWAKRAELLELAQQQKGKEYFETLERQYKAAMDAVEADISKWYIRLADNNELTAEGARKLLKRGELKEFKWGLEEYIKRGKENAIDGRWIKELENASAKVHITRLEALKTHVRQKIEELYASEQKGLTGHLRGVYERGYYHTAFDIHKGLGVAWNIDAINPKTVDKILSNPWALDKKVFSSRVWEHKTKLINSVQTELTQAVLTGKSPQRSIQDIVKAFGVSKSQASCLVMTETAAIAQLSKRDCYDDLGVEKYEIIATLDLKTSEICQEMDGKVFDMKDHAVGVTCAPFHPRCRTTDCPYFDDEFEHMFERAARDENGQVYYVPADMTYKEWRGVFVKEQEDAIKRSVKETVINKQFIKSDKYDKKFTALKERIDVERNIKKSARDMLFHRSGTKFEDIAYVNSETAETLVSNCYEKENTAKPTKKMTEMLMRAKPNTIIGIHNHPGSTLPSFGDLKALSKKQYKYGLVVCHGGTIYKYSFDRTPNDVDFALYKWKVADYYNNVYNDYKEFYNDVKKDTGILIERL